MARTSALYSPRVIEFADSLRRKPYSYTPVGTVEVATLAYEGKLTPYFPSTGPNHIETTLPIDSGRVRNTAKIFFDESGEEQRIRRIAVDSDIFADGAIAGTIWNNMLLGRRP